LKLLAIAHLWGEEILEINDVIKPFPLKRGTWINIISKLSNWLLAIG